MRIVVVGAGIVGAACAHVLASAGLDVTVLERGAVAGGTSSSCEGNILVSDKTPGPEFLEPVAFSGDDGLALVERAPFGVICSITPCTVASSPSSRAPVDPVTVGSCMACLAVTPSTAATATFVPPTSTPRTTAARVLPRPT